MRSHDWTQSPLRAPESWPDALKTAVQHMSQFSISHGPMGGPEFAMLYNDAYRPMLGATKHPGGLGRPGIESWPEIWDVIGAQLTGFGNPSGELVGGATAGGGALWAIAKKHTSRIPSAP